MSFFSKKDNDELFALLDSDENNENDFGKPNRRSGALTAEEVISFSEPKNSSSAGTGALEALKKRMLDAQSPANQTDRTEKAVEEKPAQSETVEIKAENTTEKATEEQPKREETPALDLNFFSTAEKSEKETAPMVSKEEEQPKTLLEKCRPFIVDGDDGDSAMETAPTYRLESVAEILSSESQKTLDLLSQKYDIAFDDLGKYSADKKPAGTYDVKSADKEEKPAEKQVFEDTIPTVKHIQTNVPLVISDIDHMETDTQGSQITDISSSSTIRFTPVTDSDTSSRISVSSQTRSIDLTGELTSLPEDNAKEQYGDVKLEQTEFEEYIPKEEFTSLKDAKHFLRELSLKKRSRFLKAVFSVLLTLVLTVFELPFMSKILLGYTKTSNIICTAILGIIILINYDIFASLPKIFSRRSSPDICAASASVSVIAYAVFACFKNEIALNMLLLCAFTLSVRALTEFFSASSMLSGLKQISGNTPKRAVKLIGDSAVTFAMAKNAIEGDVLAAAPQRTRHIDGYMKHTTFKTALGGKLPFITVLSVLLSVIVGLACTSYFDGALYGLYSAAAVQCFAAVPVIFLIDKLPLYSAAKKLNKLGAMLAGKAGAERIESANAVVFNSEDIFPSGTVSLHDLKVLSSNSIDDTIIRAAALTDALDSPLSPIFKKIAGTGGEVILPNSDTVKYEDKMGISGWVDNKLLFVGNRTLMEAHGIEVPNVETDRKLLRQGFFPVYVASEDKACALLAVQYTVRPDIARELRRVSALGVTMLINSSDPNMTEEMICDYIGLYEDSVKVMSAAGSHMYKNAVTFTDSVSAPAAYKGNPIGLAAIISSASRIKKSNILLTVLYVLAAVFGAVMFAYISFNGAGSLMSGGAVLLYSLIATVASYIFYTTLKP